jgi:hypothetical protein
MSPEHFLPTFRQVRRIIGKRARKVYAGQNQVFTSGKFRSCSGSPVRADLSLSRVHGLRSDGSILGLRWEQRTVHNTRRHAGREVRNR